MPGVIKDIVHTYPREVKLNIRKTWMTLKSFRFVILQKYGCITIEARNILIHQKNGTFNPSHSSRHLIEFQRSTLIDMSNLK